MGAKSEKGNLHVLVDTDAFVALSKKDDSNHARAEKINLALSNRGVFYVVSPMTIPEVVTVLSHKVNQKAAIDFLRAVREEKISELECSTALYQKADKWFFKQTKKGTSYFDCVNMALMEHLRLDGIFSFDATYVKNGFRAFSDLKDL